MVISTLVTVLLVFVVQGDRASDSSWTPQCPLDQGKIPRLIPHPTNCRSLFVCSKGMAREYYCPEGQIFSSPHQECRNEGTCSTDFTGLPAFESCPQINGKDVILFPHPTDCHMFYMCDHGVAYPRRCPFNLHFNPELRVCDWPYRAKCKARFLLKS